MKLNGWRRSRARECVRSRSFVACSLAARAEYTHTAQPKGRIGFPDTDAEEGIRTTTMCRRYTQRKQEW